MVKHSANSVINFDTKHEWSSMNEAFNFTTFHVIHGVINVDVR